VYGAPVVATAGALAIARHPENLGNYRYNGWGDYSPRHGGGFEPRTHLKPPGGAQNLFPERGGPGGGSARRPLVFTGGAGHTVTLMVGSVAQRRVSNHGPQAECPPHPSRRSARRRAELLRMRLRSSLHHPADLVDDRGRQRQRLAHQRVHILAGRARDDEMP